MAYIHAKEQAWILTPYTRINSKLFTDLNGRPETVHLGETQGGSLIDLYL